MNNTPATTATFASAPKPADFNDLINILAVIGEAERQLKQLQSNVQASHLLTVDAHRSDYVELQQKITEAEAALEVIARRNPSWFADAKTLKTPYGSVKFTSSTELVVANEEVSIKLLEAFKRTEFIRTKSELNLDALRELTDTELAQFAIVRKAKENLTVKTETIDLGKAVKAAEKSDKATKKTAKAANAEAGFTLIELFVVVAIIGILAAIIIPMVTKDSSPATPPPAAITMQQTDGENRFRLVRVTEFRDELAYKKLRAAYILTDKQTGIQYVGVSGIGITELGNHKSGKTTVEDER